MKNNLRSLYLLLLLVCLSNTSGYSQWIWARQIQTKGIDTLTPPSFTSAVDKDGNIYSGWGLGSNGLLPNDTMLIGSYKVGFDLHSAVTVFKTDANGNVKWLKKSYSNYAPNLAGPLTTDAYGNVWYLYTTDLVRAGDTLIVGSHMIIYNKVADFTTGLIEYDSNGNDLKLISFGSVSCRYIDHDDHGNIYVAGSFTTDTATFNTNTLYNSRPGTGTRDGFIFKMDNSGSISWIKQITGTTDEYPVWLDVDDTGNAYISLYTNSSSAVLAPFTINSPNNRILAKYTPTGNILWSKGYTISNPGGIHYIVADHNNNFYLYGAYSSDIVIGSDTLIWYSPHPLSHDLNLFIARGNATTGDIYWTKNYGDTWYINYGYLTVDAANEPWICAGYSTDSIKVDTTTLRYDASISKGDMPFFLARLDTSGNFQYVTTLPYCGAASQLAMLPDSKGYIYFNTALQTYHNTTVEIATDTLTKSASSGDFTILKYKACEVPSTVNHVAPIAGNISIYPNPVYDEFTIQSNTIKATIELYNISGQLVLTQKATSEKTKIDVSNLPGGMYLCRFTSIGNSPVMKKVMVLK